MSDTSMQRAQSTSRRLVVSCHWSDEDDRTAREAAAVAFRPLKAPDTKGWVGTLEGEVAQEFYDRMAERDTGPVFEDEGVDRG